MTEIPRDIAAHRAELERHVQACNAELAELSRHTERLERERDMALSEIRGIDVAVAAYNDGAAAGEALPAQRATRRDIKALAAAEIAQTPGWAGMSPEERVRYLCKQLRCKPSQIKEALVARQPTAEDWGYAPATIRSGPATGGMLAP